MVKEYATVDQVIEMLQKLSEDGKGDYEVGCNEEYLFAKPNEEPRIDDKYETVDFGGYA